MSIFTTCNIDFVYIVLTFHLSSSVYPILSTLDSFLHCLLDSKEKRSV